MIERLRELLIARVPRGYAVTEKRTPYWMDEDSAAYCDIAVSGGGLEFCLVVMLGGAADTPRNEFFARVWLRFSPEIWIVDEDTKRVLCATRDAGTLVDAGESLLPVAIDGARFELDELRGAQ